SINGWPCQSKSALSHPMRLDWPPASSTPMQGRSSAIVAMRGMRMGVGELALFLAQRAAFAPGAVAVHVVFLLPDRRLALHRLDGQPAGTEGLVTMRRAGSHHHGNIADGEIPFRMRDPQLERRPHLGQRALGDGTELVQRQ